eukprot:scaffold125125_cov39-Phaeocystis_antarctica.AAC.1
MPKAPRPNVQTPNAQRTNAQALPLLEEHTSHLAPPMLPGYHPYTGATFARGGYLAPRATRVTWLSPLYRRCLCSRSTPRTSSPLHPRSLVSTGASLAARLQSCPPRTTG